MYMMKLEWKADFKVDLAALDQQLRSMHEQYVGNQAHNHLELWFSEEPTEADKEAIQAMWEGLDEQSPWALSYKSAEAMKAEQDAQKESAKAKLAALGLTEAELKALLG